MTREEFLYDYLRDALNDIWCSADALQSTVYSYMKGSDADELSTKLYQLKEVAIEIRNSYCEPED